MLRQDLSSSRWFSAELGGGSGDASGGGGNTPGVGDTGAWEAVSRLSDEATEMAGEGDAAGAKKLLKEGAAPPPPAAACVSRMPAALTPAAGPVLLHDVIRGLVCA